MNNKGFTLIEVLGVLFIGLIIVVISFMTFGSTMSVTHNEAYKIMKNNIVAVGYDYINECNLKTINCDFSFEGNNRFNAKTLQNTGFFEDLKSPIDGKYLGECLVLDAVKSNGVVVINLTDNCY